MTVVDKILNILLPPLIFLGLLLLSPLLIFFKLFSRLQRYITPDNIAGKVAVITGAASGVGEALAYEYARRGARLTLVDRREDRLQAVAEKSRQIGSPDVIALRGDVSVIDDCKRFIEETVDHFGQLDHLVNNAGVTDLKAFEDYAHTDISDALRIMDINFWGQVYATQFAIPHLKKSKGRIVGIASMAGFCSTAKLSIYAASKAAVINFYETLRIELGSQIGITIICPGPIHTEMATPQLLVQEGWGMLNLMSASDFARMTVEAVLRRERCVIEPSWMGAVLWLKTLSPELTDFFFSSRINASSKHH